MYRDFKSLILMTRGVDPVPCAGDGVEKESGNGQMRCSKVLAWVHSSFWIRPMLVQVKRKTELTRAAVIGRIRAL